MNLKELRKKHGLTQKEAASLIGVPYRTYIRYEENESYAKTYKYKKMMEDLIDILRVDEEHGVLTIDKIKEVIIPILKKHEIKYCYLFGSYARGDAQERSDIDLLIDTEVTGLSFFKLIEEMREALCKKVDLLRLKDLEEGNPIILAILKEGIRIL